MGDRIDTMVQENQERAHNRRGLLTEKLLSLTKIVTLKRNFLTLTEKLVLLEKFVTVKKDLLILREKLLP
jgi:hypothetical protein